MASIITIGAAVAVAQLLVAQMVALAAQAAWAVAAAPLHLVQVLHILQQALVADRLITLVQVVQ
jgi:hypothetical protein